MNIRYQITRLPDIDPKSGVLPQMWEKKISEYMQYKGVTRDVAEDTLKINYSLKRLDNVKMFVTFDYDEIRKIVAKMNVGETKIFSL